MPRRFAAGRAALFASVMGFCVVMFCFLAGTTGFAQASGEKVIRLQPIQVCSDDGSVCANVNRELFAEVTAKIWAQAGVRVEFLPWTNLLGSVWLDLGTGLFDSYSIFSLAGTAGNGQHPDPTVINVWFVRSFSNGAYGHSLQSGVAQRNGIGVADNSFTGRTDVIAHELGHNLGLDHSTFGSSGSTNLMSSSRQVPSGVGDVYPDGQGLDFLTPDQVEEALTWSFVVTQAVPRIISHPVSVSVVPGGTTALEVEATGPELRYQWQFEGNDIVGETENRIVISDVQQSVAGNYRVVVSNEYGSVTSSNALLTVNLHEPVPGIDTIERFVWEGAQVLVSELLANDVDGDGDALLLVFVALESEAGGFVDSRDGWVFYTPPLGFMGSDSFTYLVTDGPHFVDGTVFVEVKPDLPRSDPAIIEALAGGMARLVFEGIPGLTYRVEFTESLSRPDWMTLTNLAADPLGVFEFVDDSLDGQESRYYRSVWP